MKHIHEFKFKSNLPSKVLEALITLSKEHPNLSFRYLDGIVYYCHNDVQKALFSSPNTLSKLLDYNLDTYSEIYRQRYSYLQEYDSTRVFIG